MLMYISNTSAFCADNSLDYSIFGNFSERSLIMKSLNGENRATQEQRDILEYKKLKPTVDCLVEQIKKGNKENAEILLEAKVNPNEPFNMDYPIFIAAKNNDTEMVKLLHSYGAKLDKGFGSELYEAIKNKNIELTDFLIDNGARINYRDSVTGNTPLYIALKNDMTDTSIKLIKKGASINQKTYLLLRKKKLDYLLEKIE